MILLIDKTHVEISFYNARLTFSVYVSSQRAKKKKIQTQNLNQDFPVKLWRAKKKQTTRNIENNKHLFKFYFYVFLLLLFIQND